MFKPGQEEFLLGSSFFLCLVAAVLNVGAGCYIYYVSREAEDDERLKRYMPYVAVGSMCLTAIFVIVALTGTCWTVSIYPCNGATWGLLKKNILEENSSGESTIDKLEDITREFDPRRLVDASMSALAFGLIGLCFLAAGIMAGVAQLQNNDDCFRGYTTLILSLGLLVSGVCLTMGFMLYVFLAPLSRMQTTRRLKFGYGFVLYMIAGLIALTAGTAAWKLLDKKIPSFLLTKYESSPRRQAFGNGLVLLATCFALSGLLTDEWRMTLPPVNAQDVVDIRYGLIQVSTDGTQKYFMHNTKDIPGDALRASVFALLLTFLGVMCGIASLAAAVFLWLGKCSFRGHKCMWCGGVMAGACFFLSTIMYTAYWPLDMDFDVELGRPTQPPSPGPYVDELEFGYSFALVAVAAPLALLAGGLLFKLEFTRTRPVEAYMDASVLGNLKSIASDDTEDEGTKGKKQKKEKKEREEGEEEEEEEDDEEKALRPPKPKKVSKPTLKERLKAKLNAKLGRASSDDNSTDGE
jgi:hypothetical protein